MKFDPKKIQFIVDSVYYDGIDVGLTRQMILDWTVQTGEDSYTIIQYYYKKKYIRNIPLAGNKKNQKNVPSV